MEIEDTEDLDLIEAEPTEYDPLGRFQTAVPLWMFDPTNPCQIMQAEIGRQEALEFFFGTHTWQQARKMCHPCQYQGECLGYALKYGEEGVWGGTTYPERQRFIEATNKENV